MPRNSRARASLSCGELTFETEEAAVNLSAAEQMVAGRVATMSSAGYRYNLGELQI